MKQQALLAGLPELNELSTQLGKLDDIAFDETDRSVWKNNFLTSDRRKAMHRDARCESAIVILLVERQYFAAIRFRFCDSVLKAAKQRIGELLTDSTAGRGDGEPVDGEVATAGSGVSTPPTDAC